MSVFHLDLLNFPVFLLNFHKHKNQFIFPDYLWFPLRIRFPYYWQNFADNKNFRLEILELFTTLILLSLTVRILFRLLWKHDNPIGATLKRIYLGSGFKKNSLCIWHNTHSSSRNLSAIITFYFTLKYN